MKRGKMRLILLMMGLCLMPTVAMEAANPAFTERICASGEITPFAEVIVKKYRVYGGRPQYRRWNETRNYWVDKAWINL